MKKWVFIVIIGLLFTFTGVKVTHAANGLWNRNYYQDYFTGLQSGWVTWAFLPIGSVNYPGLGPNCDVQCTVTLNSFLNVYQSRLNDPSSQIDQGRAAAEIDVMLGKDGTDFGTVASGIAYAQAHFAEWQSMIQTYASGTVPGYSVDWNEYVDFGFAKSNGLGTTAQMGNGDVESCSGGQGCRADIVFQGDIGFSGFDYAVVFHANGQNFYIKHKCANLTGDDTSLVIPSQPANPVCGGALINPAAPDPQQQFSVMAKINYSPATGADAVIPSGDKMFINISALGDSDSNVAMSDSGGTISGTTNEAASGSPGTFTISYGISGPLSPITCTQTFTVIQTACNGLTTTPAAIDPYQNINVSGSVRYSPAAQLGTAFGPDNMYIKMTGPSPSTTVVYSNSTNSPTKNTSTGTATYNVTIPATHATGLYTISYGTTGTAPISCPDSTIAIADRPVVGVAGGDVEAGGGMTVEQPSGGTVCTAEDDRAGVVSWNREAAGNYAGAGTKYAASVLNYLQDFATAQGSTTNPAAPSGLAFSNTSGGSPGWNYSQPPSLLGGGFGARPCVPDYFAHATNVQTGNVVIGFKAIANGTHTTMYVKGNVYITGNITYSGTYADVHDIPSFGVIVQGNIYIAPNVTKLDGLYVAEPNVDPITNNPSDGTIYTCAATPYRTASTSPTDANSYLTSSLYSTCGSSLTVNGSFVASRVWLLRDGGSLYKNASTPAEVFNFNPEVWLSTPPPANTSGESASDYDAVTGLSPAL